MQAIIGKKIGMTQLLNNQGNFIPCTVIEAGPCVVTQVKTQDKHGYKAIQIGFGDTVEKGYSKAYIQNFKKNNLPIKKVLREVRLNPEEEFQIGQEIKADVFKAGDLLDIQGTSIGHGFAGGMKRWGWKGGPESHGSMHHRRVGSIGASSFPSRVFRGQRMPGHMGDATVTVQNLEVIRVDVASNVIVVKGAVPGSDNGLLMLRRSLKQPLGVKPKMAPKKSEKKDPLKASKQAAAGKGGAAKKK